MSKLTTRPTKSTAAARELTQEDYCRIRSQIVAKLKKLGAGEEEVEELVLETFSQAHQRLAKFEGRSEFDTWVVGIAKNLWFHHLRRQHTQKRASQEVPLDADQPVADELHAHGPSPEARTAARQTLAQAGEEIAKLPDILRIPLMLQVDGYSYNEITDLLQVSQKLVTSRIHQARDQLRKIFPERNGARRQVQHGP